MERVLLEADDLHPRTCRSGAAALLACSFSRLSYPWRTPVPVTVDAAQAVMRVVVVVVVVVVVRVATEAVAPR